MKKFSFSGDRWLFSGIFLLLFLGLLMLLSASSVISTFRTEDPSFYFKRQLFYGVLPGLLLFFLLSRISLNFLKKFSFFFFLFGILLLSFVFLPQFSIKAREAARWISLGPITFQPSEIAKLFFIVFFASFLEKKIRNGKINKFEEGFLSSFLVFFPFVLLIFFQPNMGTLIIFCIIAFLMFFAAGGNIFHLFILFLIGILIVFLGSLQFPYQAKRILTFLNQEEALKESYHLYQSLIAIGSGGIFGKGFGNSIQKYFYLPQPIADTIFSIWNEEMGFIGGVILVLLYLIITLRGIAIARRFPQSFEGLLALGIVIWLFSQAAIHMMATLGLVPFTGLPLPLVSYGGSAMIANLAGLGLLINISRRVQI